MQVTRCLKRVVKCFLTFITGIVAVFGILVGITIINTLWHPNKFRFENFKTAEELINYIRINFPNGSDSQPLIYLLEGAGAKCNLISEKYYSRKDKEMDTRFLYDCTYNVGWLYYPQLIEYGITLRIDKNQKLIDFSVGRQYTGP